jgi:hypothetical protein
MNENDLIKSCVSDLFDLLGIENTEKNIKAILGYCTLLKAGEVFRRLTDSRE